MGVAPVMSVYVHTKPETRHRDLPGQRRFGFQIILLWIGLNGHSARVLVNIITRSSNSMLHCKDTVTQPLRTNKTKQNFERVNYSVISDLV